MRCPIERNLRLGVKEIRLLNEEQANDMLVVSLSHLEQRGRKGGLMPWLLRPR